MSTKWVILKFGGTSVENSLCWKNILRIIKLRLYENYRPILVCSAVTGVSNLLEQLIVRSCSDEGNQEVLDRILQKHQILCSELGVSIEHEEIQNEFVKLNKLAKGLTLIQHCSPQIRAQMLSIGELLLTKIAYIWLSQQDISVNFLDIRDYLKVKKQGNLNDSQYFLSAVCDYHSDEHLKNYLHSLKTEVIITQGFIASDSKGQTVLLGRGGSDTSAAYLGAKIDASRVEIWTDVPGMFTSNPKEISSSKLLLSLNYSEAQELATSGAKVLHPRCIDPLRERNIPLKIGWTQRPEFQGMNIDKHAKGNISCVKAVISKKNIQMISMDSIGMWHQVGFLADIFECFRKNGYSIDLVATSQSNVTVTLDSITNVVNHDDIESLCEDLSKFCKPRLIGPLASVSLVGSNIRSILHLISPVFKVFEDKQVFLISQSASDLNLTFTVDMADVDSLVKKVHEICFEMVDDDKVFGPRWDELFEQEQIHHSPQIDPWWKPEKKLLLDIAQQETPLFVYYLPQIKNAVKSLQNGSVVSKINYAMKANSHPQILKLMYNLGLGFDCVSIGEIKYLHQIIPHIKGEDIIFSPNFVPISEFKEAMDYSCTITLDNLDPLKQCPELFENKNIFLRLDPEVSKGHHKYVKTAGKESKFGISINEIPHVLQLVKDLKVKVIGLHVHVGSGIRAADTWAENAYFLAKSAEQFSDIQVLNLGGGFGVVEKPGHRPLDMTRVLSSLTDFKNQFPHFKLWIEPGRFLVAQAGVLLAQVTQLKEKGEKKFIGVDTGMNSLIRPALYGSYHEIVNLSKINEDLVLKADVVGPICESGDVLGYDRSLPDTLPGDIFLIANAGAYGKEMSSTYNKRNSASEKILM